MDERPVSELLESLLEKIEAIDEREHGPKASSADAEVLHTLAEKISDLKGNIPEENRLEIWKHCVRLWNICVTLGSKDGESIHSSHSTLRHAACLLSDAGGQLPGGTPVDTAERTMNFWCKTGELFYQMGKMEMADNCFSRATEKSKALEEACDLPLDTIKLLLILYMKKSELARRMERWALASSLLAKSRKLPSFLAPNIDARNIVELKLLIIDSHISYSLEAVDGSPLQPSQVAEIIQPTYEMIETIKQEAENEIDEEILIQIKEREQSCLAALAASYMMLENYETAMRCLSTLEGSYCLDPKGLFKLQYMQAKCLVELGQREEAISKFMLLLKNAYLKPEAAYDILLCFCKHNFSDDIASMLDSLMRVCNEGKHLIASLVMQLLLSSESGAFTTVADILSIKEVVGFLKGKYGSESRKVIWTCLWNYAGKHFLAKEFETSTKAFTACLEYGEDDSKAKTARMIALSCLGAKDILKASQYIQVAEEYCPGSLSTLFTRLKIVLCGDPADTTDVAHIVQLIASSPDCTESHLRLACRESIEAKRFDIAIASLESLHELARNGQSSAMSEAAIFRCIVRLAFEHLGLEQSVGYFKNAARRLAEVGISKFAGTIEDNFTLLFWFANMGWNQVLTAGKGEYWHVAAELVDATDVFFQVLQDSTGGDPNDLEEIISRRRMCMLLGAAAALENAKRGQQSDSSLSLARRFLCSWKDQFGRLQTVGFVEKDSKARICHCLLEFELASRENNAAALTQVLERAKTIPEFSGEYALKMASLVTNDSKFQSKQVAIACLYVALQLFLRAGHPDYPLVAETLRALITKKKSTSSEEEEDLALYKEALHIVQGAASQYPQEEIQWLAATSWNQGALHSKFRRPRQAKAWMDVALHFTEHCSVLEAKKDAMHEELRMVEREAEV